MMGPGIDLWTALFVVSLAQGLFLLGLLLFSEKSNKKATIVLMAILLALVVTNLDYFLIASGLYQRFPELFGISNGMMLLFGPLLLLYSKSLLQPSFALCRRHLWHFVPYAINFIINLPFLLIEADAKTLIISAFIAGRLPMRTTDAILLALQVAHLSVYLFWVLKSLRRDRSSATDARVLATDLETRQKWLQRLTFGFVLYLMLVVGLFLFVLVVRRFDLYANYSYTLAMSAIIYYLAYQLALHKDVVLADFKFKYKSSPLSRSDKSRYAEALRHIMSTEQPFLDPDLKLADLAERLALPAHHLSQLLNEEFSQSFFDLINHHRVEEFKRRLAHSGNAHFSILGLAMEVGFNSKSSFNTAFKKETGLTPTQFRKQLSA